MLLTCGLANLDRLFHLLLYTDRLCRLVARLLLRSLYLIVVLCPP